MILWWCVLSAAQFDTVLIESVGLGQSEVDIDNAVDMLIVVVPPGGGDGLQASKKGIMEAADLVLVNKADGNLLEAARHTKADYAGAMHFVRQKHPQWSAKVLLMSAATGTGLEAVDEEIRAFHSLMSGNGGLKRKRAIQSDMWMWNQVRRQIVFAVEQDECVKTLAAQLKERVANDELTPASAASMLIQEFFAHREK